MKKKFNLYIIAWGIMLALFNVIAFVSVGCIREKFTVSFWIAYAFITLAFIGQLACAFAAFKANDLKKFFYSLPLISISYGGLVAMLIVGSVFMAIPPLPEWIAIIVCAIILAFNAIAIVKATAAADIVSGIDEKVKAQTLFVRSLTVDVDALMAQAKSEAVKDECRKVYEAARYSDPMSDAALASVEGQITVKFAELSEAVEKDDIDAVKAAANALLILVKDRNNKCKTLK